MTWTGAPPPTGAPLPVAHAISKKELEKLSGKKLRKGTLSGIEPSPRYNHLFFVTKKGDFGVAVQVWDQDTIKDTRLRFDAMKATYPNVQPTTNLTPYTFFASWGKIYYLVFMDLKKRRVVSVSASGDVLTPYQLYQVAVQVRDRLIR